MYSTGNKTVDIVGTMNFEGNIIPNTWWQHFRKPNGKPDLTCVVILSEIVYWHRPTIKKNEQTGMLERVSKKFKGDMLQKDYKDWEETYGFSEKQVREALKRMEAMDGLVKRHVAEKVELDNGKVLYNVMYLELNPTKLAEITFPQLKEMQEQAPPEPKPAPKKKNSGPTDEEVADMAADVILYLNAKIGGNYSPDATGTKKLIKARMKEGHGLVQFKKVIDNKVHSWLGNKKCEHWLRPKTLFNEDNFDNYLNERHEVKADTKPDLEWGTGYDHLGALESYLNSED